MRWRELAQARASRSAWEHAKRSKNWVEDLSPQERKAMNWALDLSGGGNGGENEGEG